MEMWMPDVLSTLPRSQVLLAKPGPLFAACVSVFQMQLWTCHCTVPQFPPLYKGDNGRVDSLQWYP